MCVLAYCVMYTVQGSTSVCPSSNGSNPPRPFRRTSTGDSSQNFLLNRSTSSSSSRKVRPPVVPISVPPLFVVPRGSLVLRRRGAPRVPTKFRAPLHQSKRISREIVEFGHRSSPSLKISSRRLRENRGLFSRPR